MHELVFLTLDCGSRKQAEHRCEYQERNPHIDPPLAGPNSIADNRVIGRGIYLSTEIKMPKTDIEKPSSSTDEFHTSKTGQDDRIDRTAEKAAEKAGKTEKRYDQEHDIFTK
jgi:hypothetical protein